MTAAYVPVKSDRCRRPEWASGNHMDVLFVGGQMVFGTNQSGFEFTSGVDGVWIKVKTPTPLTQKWGNFYPNGAAHFYDRKAIADNYADDTRIALVHIWTDADGVDRIERVTA